jgi:hypothetical protein
MAAFPSVRSGSVALYPVTRAREYLTRVVQFSDDSEQRWRVRHPLARFMLEFNDVNGNELSEILEFWRSMKGRFDATWEIAIGGQTYQNMAFDSDDFSFVENRPNRYTVRLSCIQTRT